MRPDPRLRRSAADTVRRGRDRMAEAVTEAFLAAHPDWLERYGDAARRRGLEDARYHADFLAAAVEAGSPVAFARYAAWAAEVLSARGITPDFLAENLQQVGDWYGEELEASAATAVRFTVEQAVAEIEQPAEEVRATADLEPARSVFTQACLAGDRRAALTVVREAMRAGRSVAKIYVDILQESQYEIGRQWQTNRISVGQEHIATAVTQYVIAQVYPELERPATRRGRAVITGVDGEHHQVGANMVADLLESDGWEVRFLGTNVPPESVVGVVADHRAALVGISATMLPSLPRVTELIERLRGLERPLAVIVGGGLFRSLPDLWRDVDADGSARDLSEAVELARRLAGS